MSIVTKVSNPELYNALFLEDEIKEILDKLNKLEYDDIHLIICEVISRREIKILLDYITNLQEELEDLREDNYAYHQLMKMQNKREYRSKFLKEFQEEFGTNTFPDYDEIYKRYGKLKKENQTLKNQLDFIEEQNHIIDRLEKENERLNLELSGYRQAILRDDKLLGMQHENERLNNVINELEKHLKEENKFDEYKDITYRETMGCVLDKLKELKERE